jgi:hypothetical protein
MPSLGETAIDRKRLPTPEKMRNVGGAERGSVLEQR